MVLRALIFVNSAFIEKYQIHQALQSPKQVLQHQREPEQGWEQFDSVCEGSPFSIKNPIIPEYCFFKRKSK